jgi:putative oxidoreductase
MRDKKMIKIKTLFPISTISSERWISISLLLIRLVFGTFIVVHGYDKLSNYSKMSAEFPDPLHLTSSISLQLTIFAEFFCGLLFIVGFLTRIASSPLVFCMIIATFVVNFGEPIMEHELAPLFLTAFIVVLISGPGNISLDRLFKKS